SSVPITTLSGFHGHPDTLREMVRAVQGVRGEKSMLVKSVVEQIVSGLRGKDYLGEILAVRYWVTEHVRYINDPLHVEVVKDPQRILEEILAQGKASEDCDGMALLIACMCLILGRVCEFVVVGFGEPGHFTH